MRCPFLREEQVRSCQASPFRKQIARRAAHGDEELLLLARLRTCPVAPAHHETQPERSRCPFLARVARAVLLGGCPLARYVPWSEASLTMCGHDGHRFCEHVPGRGRGFGGTRSRARVRSPDVDGSAVPGWLFFSPNHMWMDVGDDGLCHVGLDAFLARVVGASSTSSSSRRRERSRPTVVRDGRRRRPHADLSRTPCRSSSHQRPAPLVPRQADERPLRLGMALRGAGWIRQRPEETALVSGGRRRGSG